MKVIAFNGGPRKNFNTAILLGRTLEGASSQGAETELVHLYDLSYKGCISCFECKRKNGKSYGKCAVRDELTPVLKRASEADAIVIGTPIYLGGVTGVVHSFLERLLFPHISYEANHRSIFDKRINTGLIYTFGADYKRMEEMQFDQPSKINELLMGTIFGYSETLLVNDTYQFDDYSKYATSGIDVEKKEKVRREVFPVDCGKAFDMGARLTQKMDI